MDCVICKSNRMDETEEDYIYSMKKKGIFFSLILINMQLVKSYYKKSEIQDIRYHQETSVISHKHTNR